MVKLPQSVPEKNCTEERRGHTRTTSTSLPRPTLLFRIIIVEIYVTLAGEISEGDGSGWRHNSKTFLPPIQQRNTTFTNKKQESAEGEKKAKPPSIESFGGRKGHITTSRKQHNDLLANYYTSLLPPLPRDLGVCLIAIPNLRLQPDLLLSFTASVYLVHY